MLRRHHDFAHCGNSGLMAGHRLHVSQDEHAANQTQSNHEHKQRQQNGFQMIQIRMIDRVDNVVKEAIPFAVIRIPTHIPGKRRPTNANKF